jgi:hypothetical protein
MPADPILEALSRIEYKLDVLIAALAEDQDEDQMHLDLDGSEVGGERDANRPL